ncbi:MAG: PhnD/SsuA/transferrin family substrate-binding protein [Defluviimonas sp.]|nr:PhnD/SsuA/transferrin family substrate-binding protein [Paracoccaceae bacterium]MCC0065322.1 PhnD/SsuA/transferrin family substrate-binding protein [Defluviimonas sp.]
MIASFGMYDWTQTQAAHDRLWALTRAALRAEGLEAPGALTRDRPLWDIWTDPALVLGQTCGLPFRTGLHDRVTLVGTPDYGLEGAEPGHYYSLLVARRDDDRPLAALVRGTLALNGFDSQSGWAAAQNLIGPRGLEFRRFLTTGAHRESAAAVARGRADLASVDAVTWRLIRSHMPQVASALRVVERTEPTPGLPFIAATGRDGAATARAAETAIAALAAEDRATLGLAGFVRIPLADYLAVPTPSAPPQAAEVC